MTKRYDGTSWSGADGDTRWSYEYDANGNLTQAMKEEKASGTWNEKLQWKYYWNPRDQMERADKFINGLGLQDAYVEYRYCLSCDGALSERIEHGAYSGGSHPIVSWQRYEYHGLDLMRVDERYDSNSSGTLTSADAWRTLEVSSHRPGAIGSLLGKRVYTHTNNDATPDDTKDFYYTYDPVGNVVSVVDDSGDEVYYFTQEAFGNELPVNVLGGSDWDDATDDRIVEHQTGKWRDEFTGLYYFWARWYDAEVGRFVNRPSIPAHIEHPYEFMGNNPTRGYDPDGKTPLGRVLEWLARKGVKGLDDLARKICSCKKFPLAGKHRGFIEQLCKKTEAQLGKDIRSRLTQIEEHLRKIDESPGSIHVGHWKKEIENWMSEIALVEKELAKRGAGGAAAVCCVEELCPDGDGGDGGCSSGVCHPDPQPDPNPDADPLGWLIDFIFGCEKAEAPGD